MTHSLSKHGGWRTDLSGPLPHAADLFCGLGGWTEGLLADGWDVTGYDIEAHEYDGERYPAKIPFALSQWIARTYKPQCVAASACNNM